MFQQPKNRDARAGRSLVSFSRQALLFSLMSTLLLLLPACARHLTDANLDCVKMDMSPKEVESVLGPPSRQETREMPLQEDAKTLPILRYYYDQDGETVQIHFVDGKLVAKEGTFDK